MEHYKINIENQFKCLTPFLISTLFLIIVYFVTDIPMFDIVLGFYILFWIFPILITHLHYLIVNRNVIIKVDYDNKIFYYNNKKVSFNDIELIEMHQSRLRLKKGLQLLPTYDYHYSKILLKNGEVLYVTCLVVFDFNLNLKDNVVYVSRIVASILFENLFASEIP